MVGVSFILFYKPLESIVVHVLLYIVVHMFILGFFSMLLARFFRCWMIRAVQV